MEQQRRRPTFWNIFLFCATVVTTFLAGFESHPEFEPWTAGLAYMCAVMGILVSHEMGHFVLARSNRVSASWPYFLPVPIGPFGTAGAVMLLRGRIRSRNALMEVGTAGPIAGILVTIPVLLVGLSLSPVQPLSSPAWIEGQSLLYMLLKWIAVGPIPPGHDVFLHPLALAGWIGILLTMLNLCPVGQLDGGHIVYALFGAGPHKRISRIFCVAILAFGLFVMGQGVWLALARGIEGDLFWQVVLSRGNWVFWSVLLTLFFGRRRRWRHPATDDHRLSRGHRLLGYGCLLLFAVTFMPIPQQIAV